MQTFFFVFVFCVLSPPAVLRNSLWKEFCLFVLKSVNDQQLRRGWGRCGRELYKIISLNASKIITLK